ncbi:hypothetical protein PGB90_006562 [Kerria lacca]
MIWPTLIENKEVSWIRHRDIHLLTVGRYTYTSDQRFEAIHSPHTEDWSLRIKYPQRKDSGIYECQISTTPPVGHQIYLKVVVKHLVETLTGGFYDKEIIVCVTEPRSEVLGGHELYVDNGSTINLTCIVEFTAEIPTTVQWSHENKPINFDSPRGGISLVTIKGPTTTSRLLIQKASSSDSGEYACDSLVAKPAIIRVHILNGEHPAAMHHGQASIPLCPPIISALIVPLALIFKNLRL